MPIRLLVVDDHTLFRRGLMALLARDERGTVVAEAADAGEALRHAAQHQPDVVLLDNHLPGVHAADPADGERLFGRFVECAKSGVQRVATGRFGADMKVQLVNDGPVTFWLKT